jgi:hypothetical protein
MSVSTKGGGILKHGSPRRAFHTVSDKASKIPSNNAVPGRALSLVKLTVDLRLDAGPVEMRESCRPVGRQPQIRGRRYRSFDMLCNVLPRACHVSHVLCSIWEPRSPSERGVCRSSTNLLDRELGHSFLGWIWLVVSATVSFQAEGRACFVC